MKAFSPLSSIHRRPSLRLLALLAALLLGGPGCNEADTSIEERFATCRDLVANKDTQKESLLCFTPRSRAIVSAALDERKASSGLLDYMSDYRKLLDYDDVVMPADVSGNVALLVVAKRRERETILFEYDETEGQWLIDALELSRFWKPLETARE